MTDMNGNATMVNGTLRINKEKLEEWLAVAGMTQTAFAKEIEVDDGNFSKMLNGETSTSLMVLTKVVNRTLLPVGIIILHYIDRNQEDK